MIFLATISPRGSSCGQWREANVAPFQRPYLTFDFLGGKLLLASKTRMGIHFPVLDYRAWKAYSGNELATSTDISCSESRFSAKLSRSAANCYAGWPLSLPSGRAFRGKDPGAAADWSSVHDQRKARGAGIDLCTSKIRPWSFDTLDGIGGKRVENSRTLSIATDVIASVILARQLPTVGLFFWMARGAGHQSDTLQLCPGKSRESYLRLENVQVRLLGDDGRLPNPKPA